MSVTQNAIGAPVSPTCFKKIEINATPLTAEAFEPFGQVIAPTEDGKIFDAADAQLNLQHGTPRFYIMRLPRRGVVFHRITYHAKVTQCLGGLQLQPWYMVVSRPSGSVENYPKEADMVAFRIPHGVSIKMEEGTWHAGPLFDHSEFMDFFNLELSDTNVVDHNTHDYHKDGLEFEVVDNCVSTPVINSPVHPPCLL